MLIPDINRLPFSVKNVFIPVDSTQLITFVSGAGSLVHLAFIETLPLSAGSIWGIHPYLEGGTSVVVYPLPVCINTD